MDEKQSKELALKLLEAVSAEDVGAVIKLNDPNLPFSDPDNWASYGGTSVNWDRVGVQTSEPVGAIAELIINSIDAILMRKDQENKNGETPASMKDAVRDFLRVNGGDITQLSATEQTKLAEQNILIGIKRGKGKSHYPTYTLVDFGEGQNAKDFPKTLVSLSEENKVGFPFVQGRFNMGSTGSITFCTQGKLAKGMYKLIMSKRTLDNSDGNWGWTLIRVRSPQGREKLPVVQYFAPNGKIPKFGGEPIHALDKRSGVGAIDGGTIVKLYEYNIGPNAHSVDFGLYYALTTSLLECAIPIRIYDFDAEKQPERSGLRKHGIAARTFSGMKVVVSRPEEIGDGDKDSDESNIDLPTRLVAEDSTNESLKIVRIYATGIKDIPSYLSQAKYPYRCFYTVNGQSQAKERASFFKKAKLDDLRDNLIVRVDCNEIDNGERSMIFKPDRERITDNDSSRALRDIVAAALGNDRELRAYVDTIRKRRTKKTVGESGKGEEFWKILIKQNSAFRDLVGGVDDASIDDEDGPGDKEFKGEEFPTKLDLIKPNPKNPVLELPVNTYRRIVCKTDVEDQYLAQRSKNPGSIHWESSSDLSRRIVKLRKGKLTITVYPPKNAVPGDTVDLKFGFNDPTRHTPLCRDVSVKFVPDEPTKTGKSGTKKDSGGKGSTAFQLPEVILINSDDDRWKNPCRFDENSGAFCSAGESGITVYVNGDNLHLKRILVGEANEGNRKLVTDMFTWSVGILTLSMYKKMEAASEEKEEGDVREFDDYEDYLELASSAISAHIVTLIKELGGHKRDK